MLIRETNIEDAAILVAAEKEATQTRGLLVSRAHELTDTAFGKKIPELSKAGRYIIAQMNGQVVGHPVGRRCLYEIL